MKAFRFFMPTEIMFGNGRIQELEDRMPDDAEKILLVTDKNLSATGGYPSGFSPPRPLIPSLISASGGNPKPICCRWRGDRGASILRELSSGQAFSDFEGMFLEIQVPRYSRVL